MESSTFSVNRAAVEWLLRRMATFWGKAFFDKWSVLKEGEMLDAWCKATKGLTELEFRRGVSKLHGFERPPSLPEFLKACRPEMNPLNAYYEAIEGLRKREQGEVGTWSHPAIYWASVRVSAHDLKTQTYSQIRSRWEATLAAELEKGHWEPVEVPMLQIAPPQNIKSSKEKVSQMIGGIKAITEGKSILADTVGQKHVGDCKSWARKIMERHKNGDKTLSFIQVRFAREALGEQDEA